MKKLIVAACLCATPALADGAPMDNTFKTMFGELNFELALSKGQLQQCQAAQVDLSRQLEELRKGNKDAK